MKFVIKTKVNLFEHLLLQLTKEISLFLFEDYIFINITSNCQLLQNYIK